MTSAGAPSSSRSTTRPRWVARHELGLFFVLAFALSWVAWPAVLSNPDSSPLIPFGPALAALVVTALAGGGREVLRLLRQLVRWRVHVSWYVVAVLGPFLLMGLAVVLAVAAGAEAPAADTYETWYQLPAGLLSSLVIVGCFEELGWRGFAQPRLQRTRTALTAALVIGLAWAAWHLPELVSEPTEQRPPLPFVVWVLAQSVILAWLYNSTGGSVLVVALFHASANTAGAFLLPAFTGGRYDLVFWCMAGVYVATAAAVVVLAGAERLTSSRAPAPARESGVRPAR